MTTNNSSILHPEELILVGIPGLEPWYHWISIPFTVIYLVALVGNLLILFTIKNEQRLHEPMYFFLCMLAVVDLALCTAALPKMLAIFWFGINTIMFECCFIQMTFIHCFTLLEASALMLMAYDRYIAICKPLYYSTILTKPLILKLVLLCLLKSMLFLMPQFIVASRLPYCSSVIPHCFCDYSTVVKLACGDTRVNSIYSITAVLLGFMSDFVFICFSYAMIFRAVLKLGSSEARCKAISTCVPHLYVILYFYVAFLISVLANRFSKILSSDILTLIASSYVLIPPVLNPLIYGFRIKEIRQGFVRLVKRGKISAGKGN
ncbi:olfactory receptor 52K1-like [Latimeria chalumnae]|uniref:olfactory receptor 52K1-like n=1 Tax=Latimeria chalumnae TaxID=7897 RepID=UPI0003C148E2|nr:PREDICTED: olfactory receptor 52K1-like [Latimeria chalumnae]|eukprot:XP_006008870.1 PREDICTED: olfactory receptor 52K1-like [Latimeria chalumnae]